MFAIFSFLLDFYRYAFNDESNSSNDILLSKKRNVQNIRKETRRSGELYVNTKGEVVLVIRRIVGNNWKNLHNRWICQKKASNKLEKFTIV